MDVMSSTLVMKHKNFRQQRWFFWGMRDFFQYRERMKEQVEDFINAIGAEKVVSITREELEIIVWYREEAGSQARTAKTIIDEFDI